MGQVASSSTTSMFPGIQNILVICDFQQFYSKNVHNYESIKQTTLKAIKIAQILQIPIFKTELCPEKLGPTDPDIQNALNQPGIICYQNQRKTIDMKLSRQPLLEQYDNNLELAQFLKFLKEKDSRFKNLMKKQAPGIIFHTMLRFCMVGFELEGAIYQTICHGDDQKFRRDRSADDSERFVVIKDGCGSCDDDWGQINIMASESSKVRVKTLKGLVYHTVWKKDKNLVHFKFFCWGKFLTQKNF